MSNSQWGHGYWKGVKDAQNGTVPKSDIDIWAKCYCCHFMISNSHKENDRSLYPVEEFITRAVGLDGIPISFAKKIYDYIMEKQPYGCYVSGASNDPWEEDYFVLGNMTKDECYTELEKLKEGK